MKLGDRIKKYEATTHNTAISRVPLMIRVDGRAFHTLTRGCNKPFDERIMNAMVYSARKVSEDMSGFKAAYIQSDEATFCITDYDRVETQGWFGYDLSKIISISASLMSVNFNDFYRTDKLPVFDSRAFPVPETDVVNAFLWRANDWERNSLQMYARSFFSHKALHGKKKSDIHNMLHEAGKNWSEDLSQQQKNGTFLIKENSSIVERCDILPSYTCINEAIGKLFEYKN